MGTLNQTGHCPRCGSPIIFTLLPDGKGPRTIQCPECSRFDPIKSERVVGWLQGELQPPK
jgi:DNA-directed RNA polymerase subunit RPC12/RpoP